jgi:putative spermidine/putrescine transport system ATP-binding protein
VTHGYLQLHGVTKRYGAQIACQSIDLAVGKEEFLTILGPSGSGKTTLLMMIAGFTLPDEGRVHLDGSDITRMPSHRRDIGVVFQSYALFPHLTVRENLAYPLRVRRAPRAVIHERIRWALDLMRLDDLEERYPSQLSGGQQQRVAVARAMIFQPRLMLMDEPLGALDKKLRDYMQVELKALQRKVRTAVVYVTHDQNEALAMSDRIAVMNRGRIEQFDSPRTIYQQPKSRFVAEFLGDAVLLPARVLRINAEIADMALACGSELSAPVHGRLEPGQVVTLMIRPETIVLGGAGCENRLGGLVEEVVFLGDYTRCKLEISAGVQVHIKHPSHHPSDAIRIGNRIEIGWRTHDTRIL